MRFMLFPEFPPRSRSAHANVSHLAAAFLLWPEDEKMRFGFCSLQGSVATRKYIEIHEDDFREGDYSDEIRRLDRELLPSEIQRFHGELTNPFQNDLSLVDLVDRLNTSLPKQMDKAETAAFWAGMVLLAVERTDRFHRDELRGGASVGKAIDLLEENGGPAKSVLRKHWSSHKSVAHLAAAAITVHDCFGRDGLLDGGLDCEPSIGGAVLFHTADVLNLARVFQEFGTNFVPKASSTGPILDPETTWRMPVSIPLNMNSYKSGPLTSEELSFLRERQAMQSL